MDRVVDIELLKKVITQDELLQEKITFSSRNVIAKVKSINFKEFYQAKTVKFNPSIIFIIHAFEYENEDYIKYENKNYSVLRTYYTDDDKVELTCELS